MRLYVKWLFLFIFIDGKKCEMRVYENESSIGDVKSACYTCINEMEKCLCGHGLKKHELLYEMPERGFNVWACHGNFMGKYKCPCSNYLKMETKRKMQVCQEKTWSEYGHLPLTKRGSFYRG